MSNEPTSGPSSRQRFSQIVRDIVVGDLGRPSWEWTSIGNLLLALYTTPNRQYHNERHVLRMFDDAKRFGVRLWVEDKLAILFHDAIYCVGADQDPQSNCKSEMLSCQLFDSVCHFVDRSMRDDVRDRIMATAMTPEMLRRRGNPVDGSLVVADLDIASMADPYDDFVDVGELILQECGGTRKGRTAFLSMLLENPKLFSRLEDLEQPARDNITRYLQGCT